MPWLVCYSDRPIRFVRRQDWPSHKQFTQFSNEDDSGGPRRLRLYCPTTGTVGERLRTVSGSYSRQIGWLRILSGFEAPFR